MRAAIVLAGLVAIVAPGDPTLATQTDPVAWAYPEAPSPAPAGGWDSKKPIAFYPGGSTYTDAQLRDRFHAVDWRPRSHPPMPPVVASGRAPSVNACGFCHLPAGEGRPENAALAGLPRDYIISQVHQFATGSRTSVVRGWAPSGLMSDLAKSTTPAEAAAAADYFSRLTFVSRVRVVEAATVRKPVAMNYLLVPDQKAAAQPLGARIVETPASMQRFERRDPLLTYVAYVPVGSLKRGAALAGGANGVQPCAGCHGGGLKGGGLGPPLAGRSPSYLFRQLDSFRAGARAGPDAAPMQAVTARMGTADMIALAAYAASRRP